MNELTYDWIQGALKTIQKGLADKLTKGNVKVYRVKNDITGGALSDVFN